MGKFIKKGIKFNSKLLKKLKNTENSGVNVRNIIQHLAIHPCQLKNFKESVKDLLNENLSKYNNTCNGILLGYQHIKLLHDGGAIHDDSCYIHFDVQADFFIFKPQIGKIMKGIVNRKSKDHLGVLVYESFNVSIPIDDDSCSEANVDIGDEVTFQIIIINMSSFLPYIRGKLISDPTELKSGENSNEETQNINEPQIIKIKKKKKKKDKDLSEN